MSPSPAIIAGLILTPGLIAAGQVLFKLASRDLGAVGLGSLLSLATNVHLLVALFIYGAGTIIWIYLLRSVPLSYAYMFMALTFVLVPLLSYLLLGESINFKHIAGTALIIGGLVLANL